jgi:hypothetical protein
MLVSKAAPQVEEESIIALNLLLDSMQHFLFQKVLTAP